LWDKVARIATAAIQAARHDQVVGMGGGDVWSGQLTLKNVHRWGGGGNEFLKHFIHFPLNT
jgi:hypothetical protein